MGVGTDPMTVRCGYDVRRQGLILPFSDRTEDATIIPCDSNEILDVNRHVSNPNT